MSLAVIHGAAIAAFGRLAAHVKSFADEEGVPERVRQLAGLLKAQKKRLLETPASTRADYHGAYPGGLLEQMVETIEAGFSVSRVLFDGAISAESILLVGVLHDIGKIGDEHRPYYVDAPDWKHRNGTFYEVSVDLVAMSVADRSFQWAYRYGISLTPDEWQAIRYVNALHGPDACGRNDVAYRETKLLFVMATAKSFAVRKLKGWDDRTRAV